MSNQLTLRKTVMSMRHHQGISENQVKPLGVTLMLAIDVLYHTAQQCAMDAQEAGDDPYDAVLELISAVAINNGLEICIDEIVEMAKKATRGLGMDEPEYDQQLPILQYA